MYGNLEDYNENAVYEEEITAYNKFVQAKIGLMYIHDYYYSHLNENSDLVSSYSWIITDDSYLWSMCRAGEGAHVTEDYNVAYGWMFDRYDPIFGSNLMAPNNIRPTFYLNPDVRIKEGTDGTKENPYILDVQE